jgi:hypothetical protein
MKHVGFTGTRTGMTSAQKREVARLLDEFNTGEELIGHHGDCIGADATFHALLRITSTDVYIVGHIPDNDKQRAFCKVDSTRPPRPYLKRNEDIVDDADVMIATPKGFVEEKRGSGTWAAIRYAIRTGTLLYIVYPDGDVHRIAKEVI